MKHEFWHEKWQANDIAFHESEANHLLVKHFASLALSSGDRIFVPLCGKTVDMAWILGHGLRVVGSELSELAIVQLFETLAVEPQISTQGELKLYQADGIDIYVGDIFALSQETLGVVDAVYDRAALVALPEDIRASYCQHLISITNAAPQLLITFEYDQDFMPGPPFSIPATKLDEYYANTYDIEHLDGVEVDGGLKGRCEAVENIWLLRSK